VVPHGAGGSGRKKKRFVAGKRMIKKALLRRSNSWAAHRAPNYFPFKHSGETGLGLVTCLTRAEGVSGSGQGALGAVFFPPYPPANGGNFQKETAPARKESSFSFSHQGQLVQRLADEPAHGPGRYDWRWSAGPDVAPGQLAIGTPSWHRERCSIISMATTVVARQSASPPIISSRFSGCRGAASRLFHVQHRTRAPG